MRNLVIEASRQHRSHHAQLMEWLAPHLGERVLQRMTEINKAVEFLQKMKERGATHCWGSDNGSIQAGVKDETDYPEKDGFILDGQAWVWVIQPPNPSHFNLKRRGEFILLT